ncbi:GntR family transcriptional regulator [Scopulibacillus cellulosilyticus]|uniref:GntR family transcriptional regulator n=1 Tax=Scopulibacillus cellulosilyticus TaxID=2665665 RepID=A0ABW2Q1I2_9BACL
MEINSNNNIPLYQQYAEKFRQMILNKEISVGERFPAEIDLAEKYGVARITIRKAINELVQDDLLVRKRGKGTFVAEPKIERKLVNVASFTERMQSRGIRAGARCIDVKVINADDKLSKKLRIPKKSEVVELVRLRLSNNVPVALERSYLPSEAYPGIEKENLEDNSLYQILESKYQTRPGHSSKTLELTRATSLEAKLLKTSVGSPLFLMISTVFTEENQVMEYVEILFLGDRFRFQVY